MSRVLLGLGALSAFIFMGGLQAADHNHHDAHALLKSAGHKANATHMLHNNLNGHSVHANTDNGKKVRTMHAMNGTKKVNTLKHVKSRKKHHVGLGSNGDFHFVSADDDESSCQDIQWIGFMFNLGNQIFIFWFPVEIVSVPLNECEDYNG